MSDSGEESQQQEYLSQQGTSPFFSLTYARNFVLPLWDLRLVGTGLSGWPGCSRLHENIGREVSVSQRVFSVIGLRSYKSLLAKRHWPQATQHMKF